MYLRVHVLLCFYQSRSNQIAQKDTISRNYARKFSEVGVKSLSSMFVFGAQRDQNSISATIVTFGQRNTVDTLENLFSMRLIGFLMVNSVARNLPLKIRISISRMLENRVDSTERMDFIRSRYFGPENLYQLVPGVRVVCGIIIGSRSVFEYIFEPFMTNWKYSLTER